MPSPLVAAIAHTRTRSLSPPPLTATDGGRRGGPKQDARDSPTPAPNATPPPPLPLPFLQACAYGKDAAVHAALAADRSAASAPDADGYSPLQWAALNGRTSTVAALLGAGADVN
jgi:ankyrin repeat protein